MNIIVLNAAQGSEVWHAHRATHLNASELAVAMGLPGHITRAELVRQKALGIVPEVDAATQARFDRGHELEAMAMPWAEEIIGEELYPVVLSAEVDGLPLSASFDGLTMDHATSFEHKTKNAELAAFSNCSVPERYRPQMEQGLLLSGATRCLFMASNGDLESMVWVWYESDPVLRAKIIPTWRQFQADVAAYQHTEAIVAPTPTVITGMPALFVQVEGRVVASNLPAFRQAATAFLDHLPDPATLETDQDFADAAEAVKVCKETVDKIKLVKQQAQAQASSIDELFRALDEIAAQIDRRRLDLDKRVTAVKDSRRAALVADANHALAAHVRVLNERLGADWVRGIDGRFPEAIKGLKSLTSMRDRLDGALANAKIEASATADRIDANRKSLAHFGPDGLDLMHLFTDFASVCTKPPEDFAALLAMRRQAEEKREAERNRIPVVRPSASPPASMGTGEPLPPDNGKTPQVVTARPWHALTYEDELRLYADINSSPVVTLGVGGPTKTRELSEAEIDTILNALQEFMADKPEDDGMGVR